MCDDPPFGILNGDNLLDCQGVAQVLVEDFALAISNFVGGLYVPSWDGMYGMSHLGMGCK